MKVRVPQIRTALLKRSSRYCETKRNVRRAGHEGQTRGSSDCAWILLGETETWHLVGAGQPQPVQHRNENMSRNEEAQDVGAADEPVLRPVGVDLRRDADDGHGGLEWGDEGQRDREGAHAPVGHQELLGGALAAARQGVVQPDG